MQRLRSPEGRDVFVAGILAASLPVSRATTFYTSYGDVFAVGLAVACGVLAVAVGGRSVARWLAGGKLRRIRFDKAPVT